MKMFDDIFDKTFKKYVQTDTFRLPMSVKELRLFSYKICQSFADEYYNNRNRYNSLTLREKLNVDFSFDQFKFLTLSQAF